MSDSELCLQEIGKRIMDRRKKLGLTQEALAEKGEVTTQFVSYAESGKRAMRPENLLKISSALEVSADYLLTGEIIDKDLLILSDKLRRLTPSQVRTVEAIIDECNNLFNQKSSLTSKKGMKATKTVTSIPLQNQRRSKTCIESLCIHFLHFFIRFLNINL